MTLMPFFHGRDRAGESVFDESLGHQIAWPDYEARLTSYKVKRMPMSKIN